MSGMLLVRFIDNTNLVLHLSWRLEILQEMASEMNKSKSQIFRKVSIVDGITEIVSQVTSYSKIFKVGCLHLIRGKTKILLVNRDTLEQQRGLSEAAPSRNGNRPDQAPFYGFMENVSQPTPMLSQGLMVLPLPHPIAGAGKSVLW
jgi:hypothetical protein